jgi:hypothetical protein
MYYSDSISKGFLEAGSYVPYLSADRKLSRWGAFEDPTYLGFYVRFWFQPKEYAPDGIGTDYMPQGLLLADNEPGSGGAVIDKMPLADSAQAFLRRRNEHYRAKMMKEFREGLFDISNNSPWVFQKITGLADLWKIDPKNNWRTKEKKLVIECLETISLKMSYLADLYRKAAWDSAYHRWILPDVQRFFSMEIIVTEMRNMQVLPDIPRKQEEKENNFLNQLAGIAESNTALNNIVNSDLAQSVLSLLKGEKEGAVPSFWSTGTFLQFNLDYCEFDFFSEAPPYLDSVASATPSEGATMKMNINVGRVTEINSYGLLGGLLQDTWTQYDRGKQIRDDNFSGANQAAAAGSLEALKGLDRSRDFSDVDSIRARRESERKKTPIGLTNGKSLNRGGGGPTTGAPPNPLIPDFDLGALGSVFPGLEQGLDTAIANANSFAQNLGSGKGKSLGNVYGLTPSDISAALNALSSNGAAQQFLSNFAGSPELQQSIGSAGIVADASGNEFANVVDADGKIGKAASILNVITGTPAELVQGFIGAINLMAQTVEGTPLEGQSVSDIMSIVASQNLQGQAGQVDLQGAAPTISNPGSVSLQAPSIMNTALGKILFESNLPQSTPGGKVVLSSAEVNPASERVVEFRGRKPQKAILEREELSGATPSTSIEKSVPLTGAPAETTTDERVNLESAEPSNDKAKRREELSGPNKPEAFPQKTTLTSAPKPSEETQESVRLDAPKIEKPRLKNVDLEAPNVNNPELGNANLDGPTPDNPNLGNVNLE